MGCAAPSETEFTPDFEWLNTLCITYENELSIKKSFENEYIIFSGELQSGKPKCGRIDFKDKESNLLYFIGKIDSIINCQLTGEGLLMQAGKKSDIQMRGKIKNSTLNGLGELVQHDQTHIGTFVNGVLVKGCKQYNKGHSVTGYFKNGVKHGICTDQTPTGYVKALFEDNKVVKKLESVKKDENGSYHWIYKGEPTKYSGIKTHTPPESYDGEDKQIKSKWTYSGQFNDNGGEHGKGTLMFENGETISGQWNNGNSL
ncbi:Conserved_hypothetical protein [Hexamita inflata]|uniref:MORN repeat protein n=1 Tax=Hexamita inflata TaxID=28002 RepID=A0AA86RUR9_9EUKA|nr:Conserved hypothetical protein [Hexamita inflata]